MKYLLRHVVTKNYVLSTDLECSSFSYTDIAEDASVFDDNYNHPVDIFEDNPERLFWQVRPLVMKFAEARSIQLSELETDIVMKLGGAILEKNMFAEDVLEKIDTTNTDIISWVKRNFIRLPSAGDIVCYHSTIGGMITSRGHRVTSVHKEERVAWVTGISGSVAFDALSEDMDFHEYLQGKY